MACNYSEETVQFLVAWINSRLPEKYDRIQNVLSLGDGCTLPRLVRHLDPNYQWKSPGRLSFKFNRVESLRSCFEYLKQQHILLNTDPKTLGLDRNACISLLFKVALYYEAQLPLSDTNIYNNQTIKVQLCHWLSQRLPHREKINIDMKSWRDGILLGELIHSIDDGLCSDCRYWSSDNHRENLERATRSAEEHLKVPPLISPEMFEGDLDEVCLLLYLAQFIEIWKKKGHRNPPKCGDAVGSLERGYEFPTYFTLPSVYGTSPLLAQSASSKEHESDETCVKRTESSLLTRTRSLPQVPNFDNLTANMVYNLRDAPTSTYANTGANTGVYDPFLQYVYDVSMQEIRRESEDFWDVIDPKGNKSELREKLNEVAKTKKNLGIGEKIGSGENGNVFIGRYRDVRKCASTVAVKVPKSKEPADVIRFLEEAANMLNFNHENVMSIVGFVVKDGTPHILLPFMENRDLLSHIRKNEQNLSPRDLLRFMIHVSRGMLYLSGLRFVHRDLCARNCMVNGKGVVKIGDFGFMRDVLTGSYVMMSQYKVAFRTLALELFDSSPMKFTMESDIWAFGVTCWEVFTYGKEPYQDVQMLDSFLRQGKRLNKPANISQNIYDLMTRCWHAEPSSRPRFSEIVHVLEDELRKELDELSPMGTSLDWANYENYLRDDRHGPTSADYAMSCKNKLSRRTAFSFYEPVGDNNASDNESTIYTVTEVGSWKSSTSHKLEIIYDDLPGDRRESSIGRSWSLPSLCKETASENTDFENNSQPKNHHEKSSTISPADDCPESVYENLPTKTSNHYKKPVQQWPSGNEQSPVANKNTDEPDPQAQSHLQTSSDEQMSPRLAVSELLSSPTERLSAVQRSSPGELLSGERTSESVEQHRVSNVSSDVPATPRLSQTAVIRESPATSECNNSDTDEVWV